MYILYIYIYYYIFIYVIAPNSLYNLYTCVTRIPQMQVKYVYANPRWYNGDLKHSTRMHQVCPLSCCPIQHVDPGPAPALRPCGTLHIKPPSQLVQGVVFFLPASMEPLSTSNNSSCNKNKKRKKHTAVAVSAGGGRRRRRWWWGRWRWRWWRSLYNVDNKCTNKTAATATGGKRWKGNKTNRSNSWNYW